LTENTGKLIHTALRSEFYFCLSQLYYPDRGLFENLFWTRVKKNVNKNAVGRCVNMRPAYESERPTRWGRAFLRIFTVKKQMRGMKVNAHDSASAER